jgi:hypothetical protein
MCFSALFGNQPIHGVKDRGMFGTGGDNQGSVSILTVPLPIKTLNGKVVRFSSAGGEDNFVAVTTDIRGDSLPGFFQHLP